MKKAHFLKTETLLATDEMMEAAKEKKYYMFLRAQIIEDNILKVSVYMGKNLRKGSREPNFETYVDKDKEEWTSRDRENKSWRSAKIDNLAGWAYGYQYDKQNWNIQEEREKVNEYFGTGKNFEIKKAVREFQCGVKKELLRKRWTSELEQIDEVMNKVPELPEDFAEWTEEVGFKCHEYILYDKKEEKYYCTHCKKLVRKPETEMVHNKHGYCPECISDVTFKAWRKQKTLSDHEYVGIIQGLNDKSGYIARKFSVHRTLRLENDWKLTGNIHDMTQYEEIRSRLGTQMDEAELFEYGEYKYTGKYRWCHQCRRSAYGGWMNWEYGKAIMYTKNIQEEMQNEEFAHADIARYLGDNSGYSVNPVVILKRLKRSPFIEYLEKMNMTNMCREIVGEGRDVSELNKNGRNVTEILGLDKQRINRLIKLNGGIEILKGLKAEQTCNTKLTDEQLYYISGCVREFVELAEKTGLSLVRQINYIMRQQEEDFANVYSIIRIYKDYLVMAEARGMDIKDEIVCRNRRMKEFHDRYVEENAKNENKARDAKVNVKFKMIEKNYARNKKHFEWSDNEYSVLVPKRASDITKEGRVQHHCVGAHDGYMESMDKDKTFILFLRHKAKKRKAYYTLEVDWGGRVIQAYAAYDRKPEWKTVESALNMWTKEVEKRTKEEKIPQQVAI